MRIQARLAERSLDARAEFARFLDGLEKEGAVVSFTGLARPRTPDGEPVDALCLDHHPRLTSRSIEQIAAETAERFNIAALLVVHRCGTVQPGEAIVFVAAAALHRRAAFEAADHAMDRLKTEALFWKREEGPSQSRWIDPTQDDHADRARWND